MQASGGPPGRSRVTSGPTPGHLGQICILNLAGRLPDLPMSIAIFVDIIILYKSSFRSNNSVDVKRLIVFAI